MTGGLGRRYAKALLSLTRESGTVEAAGDELSRVASVFDEPRLRAVVLNPAIDVTSRQRVVKNVVESLAVSPMVENLVRLLASRDRLRILSDVARAYEQLVDQVVGRSRVRIRSAATLTAKEKVDLTDLARRLTGAREVVVTTEVDPDLLGGVVLDTGGTVYDGSIKTQLVRLTKEMAGDAT